MRFFLHIRKFFRTFATDIQLIRPIKLIRLNTNIGEGAFSGGLPVITIICEAIKVPALESYVFYDRDLTEATLYVPAQSLDDYKAAEQWKEFGKILSLEEAPYAVDNISALISYTKKLFRNGQMYILQDSKTYTITGAEIK